MQICCIFQPVYSGALKPADIYIYGESFKFSPLHREIVDNLEVFVPEPITDMFVVNRHFRSNGKRMGDILKLTDIREFVELVPKFGKKMPPGINSDNSLEVMKSFYVNHFSGKETFHAILSYQ